MEARARQTLAAAHQHGLQSVQGGEALGPGTEARKALASLRRTILSAACRRFMAASRLLSACSLLQARESSCGLFFPAACKSLFSLHHAVR